MPVSKVYCSVDQLGNPTRIFKHTKDAIAYNLSGGDIAQWPKSEATKSIREQIFIRSGGFCEFGCGRQLDRTTGEMHEQHPRGKLIDGSYGEVSLANSVFICRPCHTSGDNAAHKAERWHTAKIGAE